MSEVEWIFNRYNDDRGMLRRLAKGLNAKLYFGEHSMLSFVKIEPHSKGSIHSHPEEQWGILLEGECIRIQSGEEIRVKPGDFWYTPGGVEHGIRTEEKAALVLDVFSPLRSEYRTKGKGFGDV